MRIRALRIAVEVLVVFAGVYAAFALDEYRSQQQEAERTLQIWDAMLASGGVNILESVIARLEKSE